VVHGSSTVVHGSSTVVHGSSTAVHRPSTRVHEPSTVVHEPSTVVKTPSTVVKTPSTGGSEAENEGSVASTLPQVKLTGTAGIRIGGRGSRPLYDGTERRLRLRRRLHGLATAAPERLQAELDTETNRRYRDLLRRPLDARAVSVTLRRLRDAGRLRLVRQGKSNHEGLYVKAAKAAGPASPESSPA
jgi:hypothetical protein